MTLATFSHSDLYAQIQNRPRHHFIPTPNPTFRSPSGRCLELGDYIRPPWMGKHSSIGEPLAETSAPHATEGARRRRMQREVYAHINPPRAHVSTRTNSHAHIRYSCMHRPRFNTHTHTRARLHTQTILSCDDMCIHPRCSRRR